MSVIQLPSHLDRNTVASYQAIIRKYDVTPETTWADVPPHVLAGPRDHSPSVTNLDQTLGDYDQTAVTVMARYDPAPIDAAAVEHLKGITA